MTPSTLTLNEIEILAAKLSQREQLQLVAYLTERLSTLLPDAMPRIATEEELRGQREREADEILAQYDAAAEMCQGEFDAVQEINEMRAERDEQVWPSRR